MVDSVKFFELRWTNCALGFASPQLPPPIVSFLVPRQGKKPSVHQGLVPRCHEGSRALDAGGACQASNAAGLIATARSNLTATDATAPPTAPATPARSRTGRPSVAGDTASTSWPPSRPRSRGGCQQFQQSLGDFAYRCDHCHRRVDRRARQLVVFCGKPCAASWKRGRRRLLRRFPRQPRLLRGLPELLPKPPPRDGPQLGET